MKTNLEIKDCIHIPKKYLELPPNEAKFFLIPCSNKKPCPYK